MNLEYEELVEMRSQVGDHEMALNIVCNLISDH